MESYPSEFDIWMHRTLRRVNRFFRGLLGWTTLLITTLVAVSIWGMWFPFISTILIGIYIACLFFPND